MAKTILTVDDSATIRQMVSFTLNRNGYTVIEAVDGQDGLGKVQGQQVDLIITDLNMPKLDGIEFIRQVRALSSCRFTPIIMLTTESQAARREEGKAAGATGWIVKPFNPDQLLAVVRKVAG